MVDSRPRRLGDNLTHSQVTWQPLGAEDEVPSAASEWLQHLIVQRLLTEGWDATKLTDCVGGTKSGWQNKLNGHRALQWHDVVQLMLAVDIDLLSALPLPTLDVADLVPLPYRDWLDRREPNSGMPQFRPPHPDVSLLTLATALDSWERTEISKGREWAITPDVFAHRLLFEADKGDLSSLAATIGDRSHDMIDLEWPTRGLFLRICWGDRRSGTPTSDDVRTWLMRAGHALFELGGSTVERKVLVHAANPTARQTFRDAIGVRGDGSPDSKVVGPTAAEALGLQEPAAVVDLHLTVLAVGSGGNADWFTMK